MPQNFQSYNRNNLHQKNHVIYFWNIYNDLESQGISETPIYFPNLDLALLTNRNSERYYLCKFLNKAVIDSKWIASSNLLKDKNFLKQKIKRFDSNYEAQINLKLLNLNIVFNRDWVDTQPEDSNPALIKTPFRVNERSEKFTTFLEKTFLNSELHYINFDRNTLKVDRVVSCSEMFDIIHPKKAGKIMSKWSDSIVKIVQILINFRYENVSIWVQFLIKD